MKEIQGLLTGGETPHELMALWREVVLSAIRRGAPASVAVMEADVIISEHTRRLEKLQNAFRASGGNRSVPTGGVRTG